jgi:hypothetical protein
VYSTCPTFRRLQEPSRLDSPGSATSPRSRRARAPRGVHTPPPPFPGLAVGTAPQRQARTLAYALRYRRTELKSYQLEFPHDERKTQTLTAFGRPEFMPCADCVLRLLYWPHDAVIDARWHRGCATRHQRVRWGGGKPEPAASQQSCAAVRRTGQHARLRPCAISPGREQWHHLLCRRPLLR